MGKDRPMVASPIVFVSTILLNNHWTVRIVFHHNAIGVRRALVFFVYISVCFLLTLVSWHE